MDSFVIRPAVIADLPVCQQFLSHLFALEPDFPIDPAKQLRGLTLLMHCSQARLLVAEGDSTLLGMASAQLVISTAEGGPSAWVEDLFVLPQHRGRGIGRSLLFQLQHWAWLRGASRLQLVADRGNQEALDFYNHEGWQVTRLIALRKSNNSLINSDFGE